MIRRGLRQWLVQRGWCIAEKYRAPAVPRRAIASSSPPAKPSHRKSPNRNATRRRFEPRFSSAIRRSLADSCSVEPTAFPIDAWRDALYANIIGGRERTGAARQSVTDSHFNLVL